MTPALNAAPPGAESASKKIFFKAGFIAGFIAAFSAGVIGPSPKGEKI